MKIAILICSVYIIGFIVSLIVLHKYKDQLDINHYDPPHSSFYDDWNSNAEAYIACLIWPIWWIVNLFINGIKNLVKFSKWIESKTNKKL